MSPPRTRPSASGMSMVKLRDRSWLKFGARSGWLASTPVSITPTVTRRPVARRWASNAPIISMFHCRLASGSCRTRPARRSLTLRRGAVLSGRAFLDEAMRHAGPDRPDRVVAATATISDASLTASEKPSPPRRGRCPEHRSRRGPARQRRRPRRAPLSCSRRRRRRRTHPRHHPVGTTPLTLGCQPPESSTVARPRTATSAARTDVRM